MTLVGAVPPRAFLTWLARSSRRAASGYVPVALTARVGAPPPTRTTSPGFGPATPLLWGGAAGRPGWGRAPPFVWSWSAGPGVARTATAVTSFMVEAGIAPSVAFCV